MSSKAAQLVGSSFMNSNLSNRSIMTPSPLSAISSINDDMSLVNGSSGGGGGAGGGGHSKFTNHDSYDIENNFMNVLNSNDDSNYFFRNSKNPLLPLNYQLYNDNDPTGLMLNSKMNLFDLSNMKQQLNNQEQQQQQQQNLVQQRCGICGIEPMIDGKTLVGCYHSFCQPCLIQSTFNGLIQTEINGLGSSIITCPICSQETLIPNGGIDSLMPHYSNPILLSCSANLSSASNDFNNMPFKASYLSSTSSSASSSSSSSSTTTNSSPQISNSNHYTKSNPINLEQFNKNNQSTLKNNFMLESNSFNFDSNAVPSTLDQSLMLKRQLQQQQQQQQQQQMNKVNQQIQMQQQSRLLQIENDIQKTFSFYAQLLGERRDNLIKELHSIFQFVLKQNNNKLSNGKAIKSNGSSEDLKKQDEQNEDSNSQNSNDLQLLINNRLMSIEFVANLQNIQEVINQSFGYIRYNNNNNSSSSNCGSNTESESKTFETSSQPSQSYRPKPIGSNSNFFQSNDLHDQYSNSGTTDFLIEQLVSNIGNSGNQMIGNQQGNNKQMGSSNPNMTPKNQNQKTQNSNSTSSNNNNRATSWSSVVASSANRAQNQAPIQNKGSTNGFEVNQLDDASRQSISNSLLSSSSTLSSSNDQQVSFDLHSSSYDESNNILSGSNPLPAKSQIKRHKMTYSCKFGEFGVTDGQFTEPSGVSIGLNNDIIVADTNSHRIQIFDNEGRFKFKFGECGKREGQLLYPNRVAVVKSTGDIVVTERSPTHQIQIYNQYGQFLRKFGANILQHPRGVCVDSKNRIIVVECKVMRVIIFDIMGNVLHKFNCAKYLEFPNGCCCSNDREEIFISDNRAHCIKVFNYEGQFLRQIGGEGITNYPIGVGINSNGEVLVADNHNNFNLTVFNQDGQMITALESKVKHAQCFDVGLMDDGSIVLASKDYRIYVYKYNSQNNNSNNTNDSSNSLINGSSANYSNSNSSNQVSTNNNSLINSINAFNNF